VANVTNKQKIEKLKEYLDLIKELDTLMETYTNLRMKLISPKIPQLVHDKIRVTMTDTTTENLAEMCDLETCINQRRIDIINNRREIENSINNVDKAELRTLLYKRYINGMKWENVAVEMSYSWKQVHRLHSKALEQIIFKDDTK
jgi:hypothetical protein